LKTESLISLIFILAMLVGPVLFSYVVIFPFLPSMFGLVLLIMHFVFAGGFLTLYVMRNKIKKLFS
jgi:hypothetical protein